MLWVSCRQAVENSTSQASNVAPMRRSAQLMKINARHPNDMGFYTKGIRKREKWPTEKATKARSRTPGWCRRTLFLWATIKVTIAATTALKADSERYAALHAQPYGEPINAAALIPRMLEAFMARDQGFKRAARLRTIATQKNGKALLIE